jgi:membrane-bound lytic murein transglycosylase D
VRKLPPILLLLFLACTAPAQEQLPTAEDLFQSVEQWARENLDESVLQMLDQVDQDRVRDFFSELQRRFEGTSVYELSSLKDTASRLLPVLQKFEETRPYAVWLQTHFDYFDTAEELRRETKPPPIKPGTPVPLPNPTPQLQRSVWNKRLVKRPLPALAAAHVPRLKEIFAAEKMPPELVWLAEVESSFDPSEAPPARPDCFN